jgi:ABC-type uncharacterized transport system substrate-binding protein
LTTPSANSFHRISATIYSHTAFIAVSIVACVQTMFIFFKQRRICAAAVLFSLAAVIAPGSCVPPASSAENEAVVVKSADIKPYRDALRGLRDSCGCDVREARLGPDDGPEELLRHSPKLVFSIGTRMFKKVRTLTSLPVIYCMVMPSETTEFLRPNISGVSMDVSPAAYLDAMREVFPTAKRIGLIYDPGQTAAFVEEAVKAARAAGMEPVVEQVREPSGMPAALDALRGRIDVFWMLPDPTVVTPATVELLLRFSFQRNVPLFSFAKKYVEMGAVASLDVDPYDLGAQAGEIGKRLLSAQAGPIREYARTFDLTINVNVARKMGFKIREEVLKKAETID